MFNFFANIFKYKKLESKRMPLDLQNQYVILFKDWYKDFVSKYNGVENAINNVESNYSETQTAYYIGLMQKGQKKLMIDQEMKYKDVVGDNDKRNVINLHAPTSVFCSAM